jgi:hypothetical protein
VGNVVGVFHLAADLPIEAASSSAAEATVCTLAEASSVAAATAVAWRLVCSAVEDKPCAVESISGRRWKRFPELRDPLVEIRVRFRSPSRV